MTLMPGNDFRGARLRWEQGTYAAAVSRAAERRRTFSTSDKSNAAPNR